MNAISAEAGDPIFWFAKGEVGEELEKVGGLDGIGLGEGVHFLLVDFHLGVDEGGGLVFVS